MAAETSGKVVVKQLEWIRNAVAKHVGQKWISRLASGDGAVDDKASSLESLVLRNWDNDALIAIIQIHLCLRYQEQLQIM